MNEYHKQNLYETYKIHTYACIAIIVLSNLVTLLIINTNLKAYKIKTETTFIYNRGASILISDIHTKIIKPKKNARTHKTQ
jgi:NifU-like protein involved in Fe-S cluster formation